MDNINIFNLPDDVIIKIFNLSADPAQLSSVSKKFQEVFNEEFADRLFNDYRHQPHLKDLANKVNEDRQNENAIQKVRALYTTLIESTKEIEKGDEIRKESFQHYHNAIDPKRLDEIAGRLEVEEAMGANAFFSQVINQKSIPGFQLFTEEELRQQDEGVGTNKDAKEILKVKKYREWIDTHSDQIAQIKDINISDCHLIPKEIKKFTGLETIIIEQGKIRKIPSEIGQLKEVKNVIIFNAHIDSIPPEIGQLAKLEVLDLGYNRITTIPPEIGKLQQLTKLKLGHNQIDSVSSEIGELRELKVLDLNSNNIRSFPDEIEENFEWKDLLIDVSDNPLLETTFKQLRRLSEMKEGWTVFL